MLRFENRAWEEAEETFRLVIHDLNHPEKDYIIKAIEISTHRTAPDGHIFVEEYCYKDYTWASGQITKSACFGKMTLFKTYQEVKDFIDVKYGPNNLKQFEQKITTSIENMLNNEYVKQWKGIK